MSTLRVYLATNRYALVALAIIVTGYCTVLTPYFLNIPREDDFPELYGFVGRYANEGGFSSIIALYSDHRIALLRLAGLVSVWLTGSINLQQMGYVGIWLIIPATAWLFIRFFQRANVSAIYLLPVFLGLFQPQYYESVAKVDILYTLIPAATMTGWAIYSALFGKTLTWQLSGAIVWCTLATLTFGSGLFAWFVVGLVWLIDRRWRYAIGWYALTGLVTWLYMQGHERSGYMHDITGPFLRDNYQYILQGWLSFLGAALSEGTTPSAWNAVLGGFIVSTFGYLTVRNLFFSQQSTAFSRAQTGLLLWLACTLIIGGVTALGRVSGSDGVWTMLLGRYKFYTALAIVLTYSAIIFQYINQRHFILTAGGLLTLVFSGWSYNTYLPEMDARYNSYVASIVNWQRTGSGLCYWNQVEGDSIMREAIQNGYYKFPENLPLVQVVDSIGIQRSAATQINSTLHIDQKTITRSFGNIRFREDIFTFRNDKVMSRPRRGDGMYLLLKNARFTYVLATEPKPYRGHNPLKRQAGYTVTMRSTPYRPGKYAIYEMRIDHKKARLQPTGKFVVIDNPHLSPEVTSTHKSASVTHPSVR